MRRHFFIALQLSLLLAVIAAEGFSAIDFTDEKAFSVQFFPEEVPQNVKVFYKNNEIKRFVASGGALRSPTPKQKTRILEKLKGTLIYEKEGEPTLYFTSFSKFNEGPIGFHSWPMDAKNVPTDFHLLGKPASHGCVRLSLVDAAWIYEHLPVGTEVIIH